MYKNTGFLLPDVQEKSPDDAFFHFIPVPLEQTVSYGKGTKNGPLAILKASSVLETFDGISIPADLGIHTYNAINCSGKIEKILENIKIKVSEVIQKNKFPIILGGEHSLTYGCIKGIMTKYKDFGVIQFDAHADLRDSYHGDPYSHASVMKRIFDEKIPIMQLAIRSMTEDENKFINKNKISCFTGDYINKNGIKNIKIPKNFPKKVFITIDIDALDPSIIPSTGTPEPGGLNWYQIIELLNYFIQKLDVIGFDVVELAPVKNHHSSDYITAKLIYKIMGMIQRKL